MPEMNEFERICRIFAKGCGNTKPTIPFSNLEPWQCKECSEFFLKLVCQKVAEAGDVKLADEGRLP